MKDQVKEATDLVALISEYTPLNRFHKAKCPFHPDKTASLSVHRGKNIWKCFGCNKGGDCFTFYMEIMGCDFVTALKALANKLGIPLSAPYSPSKARTDRKRINNLRDRINALEDVFLEELLEYRKDLNKKDRNQWDSTDYLIEQLITHKMNAFECMRT